MVEGQAFKLRSMARDQSSKNGDRSLNCRLNGEIGGQVFESSARVIERGEELAV
jgi:hypothetical protein